ncbi:hypothetical protein MTO96_030827 [Rhipicephalus appendiculatus]
MHQDSRRFLSAPQLPKHASPQDIGERNRIMSDPVESRRAKSPWTSTRMPNRTKMPGPATTCSRAASIVAALRHAAYRTQEIAAEKTCTATQRHKIKTSQPFEAQVAVTAACSISHNDSRIIL